MKPWINNGKRSYILERVELHKRLKRFLDDEARSCSMDYGCVTPEYVHRMWGGNVSKEEVEVALKELKSSGFEL